MAKNKKNIQAKPPIRMRKRRHPDQPLVFDEHGVVRFKQNALVRWLLDFADEQGMGLDHIVRFPYKRSDYEQLMQLIGYSVEDYCELSNVGEKSKDKSWERMCELQYALEL